MLASEIQNRPDFLKYVGKLSVQKKKKKTIIVLIQCVYQLLILYVMYVI